MAALQTTKDPGAGVTKTQIDQSDGQATIPEARQDFLRQIKSLATSARTAIPGTKDTLETRANELVAKATTLATNGAASLNDAKSFLSHAEALQRDTQIALATQRNPWSIKTAAAQDSSRFNQVVTLSVPRGQVIDVHYNRASTNGCLEKGQIRLCPGTHGPIKSSAGELWRQPDPNKPGFDTITVATFERHCEPTRCGGIQRDAFRGFITVKDPCSSKGFNVNINNGVGNPHLTSESGVSALKVSEHDLMNASALYEMDPGSSGSAMELLSPSAADYSQEGRGTVEKRDSSLEKSAPLPPQFSVATKEIPLQVVLKPGESLFVYKNSSIEGAVTPIDGLSEHMTTIGDQAAVARLTETRPGGEKVYEIRPDARPSSEPYHFKIMRWGDSGQETLAESNVYLGTASALSPSIADVSLASPKLESGQAIVSKLDVVLPTSGSYASVSKPLTIQLGKGPVQLLNIYEKGGSHIGAVLSTSTENSWTFGNSAIRMERDTSEGAPRNRFHLFADASLKEPMSFNLSVISPSAPRTAEKTSITVGPDQAAQFKKPEEDEALKRVEATRLAMADPDQEQKPKGPTIAEPLVAEQKKPITITVRRGESLFVDYERRDQDGKLLSALVREFEMAGDTVGTSIPGVGKLSRTKNPDGTDVITVTPEEGFHGEISTRRSGERAARVAL